MSTETVMDPARLDALLGQAVVEFGATVNAALVVIGDRLGLYRALAEAGPATAAELAAVYASIEDVDLTVGLYAEPPPAGFGFSDTAFRIFILMASRRLKSDRFFTRDFTPEVYTPEGMRWIDDNDMSTVLVRHYPDLAPVLRSVQNAFAPWPLLGQRTDGGV
jgi:hypothetical protein